MTRRERLAHILRTAGSSAYIASVAAILLFSAWSAARYVAHTINPQPLLASIAASDVIALTNTERSVSGLTPLTENAALRRAAQMKADDMAREEYYAHVSPDGEGLQYWLGQAGYRYLNAGENLVVDRTSAKQAVEAWMGSRTHRDNILRSQFTEIGVGIAEGKYKGQDTIYIVQMFGTPSRSTPVPAPQRTPAPESVTKPVTVTITVPVTPPVLPVITPIAPTKNAPVSTSTIPAKRDPLVATVESRASPIIANITPAPAAVVVPSSTPSFTLPTWAEPVTLFDTPTTVIQSAEVAIAQSSQRPQWITAITGRVQTVRNWFSNIIFP